MKRSSSRFPAKRTKFLNPPVQELRIGLFFLPISELRAQHVGSFWDCIREKYPSCEQQPPIIGRAEGQAQTQALFQPAAGELFPLPGFAFSSDSHPMLIRVQRNAFMLNWRREATTEDYPHYEAVVEEFWRELQGFRIFVGKSVGGKIDPIERCELTYVNLVAPNETFENPDQVLDVLPHAKSLFSIQTEDRRVTGLNATVVHRLNPTLSIDTSIRLGQRIDAKGLAAILELKAHGVPVDLSLDAARDWYDSAHDAIYQLFLDATDKKVQKTIWKPR